MSNKFELLPAHLGAVGGLTIRRALPTARRRMVGAWCFLDHAGPAELPADQPMRVGPHPHTGLQTFSWLIEGEVLHRDSLGTVQMLRPGQVNLMTAGRGIAHSEESQSGRLQLAQLWIALPDAQRFCAPAFEHFPLLPQLALSGFDTTLLLGRYGAAQSPVPSHSPLLGMDLRCQAPASTELLLTPGYEHGLMALEGELQIGLEHGEAITLSPGQLLYLAPGAHRLQLGSAAPARALLLGGTPFEEPVLLWWNFVGRSGAEIQRFAADWNAGSGFGVVQGYEGERLLAPDASGLKLKSPARN
ncbi:pirin family protein [Paucibacter soli]|uniref:pirin family protein n=1 Tax=Paucibacter soli TaxID=3133433 RepID=UPI0030AF1100